MLKSRKSRLILWKIKRNAPEIITVLISFVLTVLTIHEVREHSHGYHLHRRPNITAVLRGLDFQDIKVDQPVSPPPQTINTQKVESKAVEPQSKEKTCHIIPHIEFKGSTVKLGSSNFAESDTDCCSQCEKTDGCNVWVWCSKPDGCGVGRKHKECWLKGASLTETLQEEGFTDINLGWTSGSIFPEAERNAVVDAEKSRLQVLRQNKRLPLVYFDITIQGKPVGRMEIILFADVSPIASENFRALCTGEMGIVPDGHDGAGKPYHFKGSTFYRIVDRFICQSGALIESIYGGTFRDDPKGLHLKHDRLGVLSMANNGRDTNTAHFSILMAAAPHLNGKYVIFGEVVSGLDVLHKINAVARGKPNNAVGPEEQVVIADSGEIKDR
ncbi:hypothetical protein CEUSTIGMA_g3476.t1 [Chlamydomonas eustigma]|uniref:PPIase cyclophilin-type domain-containing protein n=1 Tax=Chlamydomonas eustigma TaxID=1157962 RepID=A0A250WYW3_9CHLO|nr:hypothetical protein CEUSTIGMA_g3476.t1 [Chlamydomonas eustigma]|eukprot:GAX76033.1 hypothetical protein CEUSTIGMA_g3476.t1 [Chlamydomonas eustigma]